MWALAEEPSAAHIVGLRDVAIVFFEDALALRIGNAAAGSEDRPLKSIAEKAGFLDDLKAKTFQPVGDSPVPNYPTAWLPTARLARAWQALVTETPFEKSAQALLPMQRDRSMNADVKHLTASELEAGLTEIGRSPKTQGVLDMIVRRPQTGTREILRRAARSRRRTCRRHVESAEQPPDRGRVAAPGDADQHHELTRDCPGGAGEDRWPLAGDQLFVDMDLTADNLPPRTRLTLGSAVIEVTGDPHTNCSKFVERFGVEAIKGRKYTDSDGLGVTPVERRSLAIISAGADYLR